MLRYGVDPLSEGVLLGIGIEVEIYLDEGLLHKILRSLLISSQTHFEEAHYSLVVACIEVLEGLLIALRCEIYESAVCSYDVVVYLHTFALLLPRDRVINSNIGPIRSYIQYSLAMPLSPSLRAVRCDDHTTIA